MKIAHLIHGEILAPAVHSQTFPLLRGVRDAGHEVHLVVLTSPRRLVAPGRWRLALREAGSAAGGRLTVLTHAPRLMPFHWSVRAVRRALAKIGPDVVHARQSRAAVLALRAGTAKVVADLRGIRPEEYVLSLGKSDGALTPAEARVRSMHREQQAEALAGASAVVCVSEPFARHLSREDGVFVIPNVCAPIEALDPGARDEGRRRLGIGPGEHALVYSGSLAAWQCAREALRLARGVSEEMPGCRFVLLTHDAAAGRELLAEEGLPDAPVLSLTPEKTRALLPAFDLALLLRRDHLVNRVSSPVKFAEYLHAGLPVALTAGIGDASTTVERQGLGVLLPSPDDAGNAVRVAKAIPAHDGELCRSFARANLTFAQTVPLYLDAFSHAACQASG